MKNKYMFTSYIQSYNTPRTLYNELNKEFNFNFDPCPIDRDFDGLKIDWKERNFINTPYKTSLQNAFLKKGLEEFKKNKLCVFLLPARTSTKRFHEIILPYATEIRFIKGRLSFSYNNTPSPFPSMIVIFNPDDKK